MIFLGNQHYIPYQFSRNLIKIYRGDVLLWEYKALTNSAFLKYDNLNIYVGFGGQLNYDFEGVDNIDFTLYHKDNIDSIYQTTEDTYNISWELIKSYNPESIQNEFIARTSEFDFNFDDLMNASYVSVFEGVDNIDFTLYHKDNIDSKYTTTEDIYNISYSNILNYNIKIDYIAGTGEFDFNFDDLMNASSISVFEGVDNIDFTLYHKDNINSIYQTTEDTYNISWELIKSYNPESIQNEFIARTSEFDFNFDDLMNASYVSVFEGVDNIDFTLYHKDNINSIYQTTEDTYNISYSNILNYNIEIDYLAGTGEFDFNFDDLMNASYVSVFEGVDNIDFTLYHKDNIDSIYQTTEDIYNISWELIKSYDPESIQNEFINKFGLSEIDTYQVFDISNFSIVF